MNVATICFDEVVERARGLLCYPNPPCQLRTAAGQDHLMLKPTPGSLLLHVLPSPRLFVHSTLADVFAPAAGHKFVRSRCSYY